MNWSLNVDGLTGIFPQCHFKKIEEMISLGKEVDSESVDVPVWRYGYSETK
ncbi:MAG: hypothetical protein NPIRA02_38150 [Nitrospirales bacterium]|nr:MAG: hypothetical protein NPIRA02_38150 [Nitrospirales bacterium]